MGLLKTAARVGVASSVHGRVQRRQQQRWAAEDQRSATVAAAQHQAHVQHAVQAQTSAPAPAPAGDDMNEKLAQLKQLGELRDAGILTDTEFEAKKAQILS